MMLQSNVDISCLILIKVATMVVMTIVDNTDDDAGALFLSKYF